jgi:Flp pilus assembly protein TadD
MKSRALPSLLALCGLGVVLCGLCVSFVGAWATPFGVREDAYRANNRGVALLEQFRPGDAAEAFREALKIDPTLAIARANLAIALFNVPDLAGAEREARAAAQALPDLPPPRYILGLVARGQNRVDEAEAAFQKVLALDPADVGALVNLGQLYLQARKYPEAVDRFKAAVAAEPYNATAVYNLGLALIRSGQPEEGQRMLERFRVLREGGYGSLIGQNYPEQGRYAEAVTSTGAEPDLVDSETPPVRFADATARVLPAAAAAGADAVPPAFGRTFASVADAWPALPGAVTLFDADGDGALDVYAAGPQGQRLYRNEKGRFVDVTEAWGLDPKQGATGAVAGDYDNDEHADLLVLRRGGVALLHNDGHRFSDASAAAGIGPDPRPYVAAALVDADHDGDLDIVLAGLVDLTAAPAGAAAFPDGFPGSTTRLLQNDGSGHFKDVSAKAGVAVAPVHAVAVVPTDFDNRRDVDLLVVRDDAAPQLFQNMRDGTFQDAAARTGLTPSGGFRSVAAADVNKDGFTDFFLGRPDGPGVLALSDGKGRFTLGPGPSGSEGATAAQLLDYDNDGLLDLLVFTARGPRLLRNLGRSWADVTATALPASLAGGAPESLAGASFAAADLDGDGATDLLVRLPSGALRFWQSQGGRNHSITVRLAGLVSNRSGVGAKVEMRAGSLRQKLETSAATPPPGPADLVFGLGARPGADAVRVLWPAGILQTEMGDEKKTALAIKELDRKPSSCPYLYAWNGERFAFVTDFMGGGEMGYWEGPGEWNHPDPDEYVRLTDEQLRPRDGRYELRVTNELEEGLFVDRLALMAVAHPADEEVFPDEGLRTPPPRFRLFAARGARPPLHAVDEHGHDVADRVARLDRRYPDDFALRTIRGYAEDHSLTLDFGPEGPARALLLLTGWTDYAFSSDNVAAHQAGLAMRPPVVEVEDGRGAWRSIGETGIPVGRPQTLVVDLAGKWRPGQRLRLTTNMRVYWDQIRLAAAGADPGGAAWMRLSRADLRERGFSAELSPDGRSPFSYDYALVGWDSPWKVMPGRYTRPGDVRELLAAADDLFVTSRPGDEIALSFDASSLPALAPGQRRTFLLYADGFSKEMDVNSASPDVLAPLPFHGMTRYPYGPDESYPMTPERRAVIERYNTRVVAFPLPPLELRSTSARGR